MRRFICISGKAQNGKDTSANIFKDELTKRGYSVLIAHQGDLLKYICKTFFGWNGEKDEAGRTLLQYTGTEVIRKVKPNFWVDFIEEITDLFKGCWDYIVIPDTRFPNEISQLIKPDSKVFHVRVVRDNFVSPLTIEQQNHLSETALDNEPYDFIVHNNKEIKDLVEQITPIINEIEKRCENG